MYMYQVYHGNMFKIWTKGGHQDRDYQLREDLKYLNKTQP